MGRRDLIVFFVFFSLPSVFIVLRFFFFLPRRSHPLLPGALFSWSCAGFQAFLFPPCVYLSVWTCSPGGIVGVGVLSGLIAAWCLVGRRAWLGRRWGKTSCPRSLLSLSHPFFCLSSFFFFFFSLPSRWLSTWLHRMMAVLHGSLTGRERETDRHKRIGEERVGGCREGSSQTPQTQVTTVLARRLLTTSKPLDASRGATRAAKWVRKDQE